MTKEKKFITCDGNYAASYISYMFSEVACIYPITPSSTMAEVVDEWAANGRKNIWGQKMRITEMQSEGGAAGAVHGSLQSGTLTTTYTASQGLLLMIPNMYKIAGELLPSVFHVSARALAGHALSIFGDHSDVYACRQTGFAMLASGSVQETMDLSGVAHLATLKTRVPFLNFFDGFRTSHEIQKIQPIDQEKIAALIDQDALQAFRDRALNPEHPFTRGTAQNPDIFFQAKEACNPFYDAVPDVVEAYMQEITKITGREYHPFTYYGDKEAENVIVAMGSVTETIREVIDYLNGQGKKYGLVSVHLYRPFAVKYFMNVMPSTVKKITVLDRTKEPGANGEPLYLDVRDAFYGKENCPIIVGGRYGLGSKDVTPSQIIAVYKNMEMKEPKGKFTIGIVDDVTFTSLPLLPEIKVSADDIYEAKFYGLGSDGTVGANKNSIKIIGSATDKYCQAYFAYDSKKSGGFTASHLRFGDSPIRSTYLITTPDFVACHVQAYINLYDVLKGLKKGGSFLLNTIWEEEEVKQRLPNNMKKYLAENEIKFYTINGTKLAVDLGLGNRTNTIMQSAFFRITNVIPYELAVEQMKKAIVKSYGMKGEQIVNMNFAAVDAGGDNVSKIEVPAEWANLMVEAEEVSDRPDFIRRAVDVINAQKGDDLPVSIFKGIEDGTFPAGTTQYEKRGIAVDVPEWIDDNCIQCNQCSYVCPHAAIRPFLISEEEMAKLPAGTTGVKANGKQYAGLTFRIQVAPYDCTGCGNCADVCPSKEKALIMKPLESQLEKGQGPRWDAIDKYVTYKDKLADKDKNIKNSQFAQPLFEFSGACAGCGETPYIKLITQLFGERMMVANATGCSSIYGGSAPATSYSFNKESGHGPAWANSLFEDNAEYGFGMNEGVNFNRDRISSIMTLALEAGVSTEETEAFNEWIENRENAAGSEAATAKVLAALTGKTGKYAMELVSLKQYMIKKSVWIFGGDGWAYDIGYGGLDHVLASGQNVNILVLDTEVYSNTGGQSSKSTPIGAVAKFAAAGKRIRKKDLGVIAMSYGYVYVAQVAMGANQAQYLKTIREAEAYPGPSLIIAYSPCIAHGLRSMGRTQEEEKLAVECGYWHLYRYNPQMEDEGKNPFQLDSKEPDWSKFQEYLNGEVRYTALKKSFPKEADELFQAAQENALWRYRSYQRMSNSNWVIAAPAAE